MSREFRAVEELTKCTTDQSLQQEVYGILLRIREEAFKITFWSKRQFPYIALGTSGSDGVNFADTRCACRAE